MEKIELKKITKNKDTIVYDFSYTKGLAKFLTGKRFTIHYPTDVSDVPDSVLTIPFLSNLIHLVWITNSVLFLPSLDFDFYRCIPELKQAFSIMFPETNFLGEIVVKKIEKNAPNACEKNVMLFSGGVDSFQTLISHHNENIDLITVWGSDIKYDNEEGWNILYKSMKKSSEPFNLELLVIHSSFRDIADEKVLYQDFHAQLKDSWWHGLQHGIGLLSHVAPLAYKSGYKKLYIASTHSFHDTNIRCSSHPSTDNCVRFCGCQVVHDGFEFRRQSKIKNIINFSNSNPDLPINLHVCWKTQTGDNCSICEKCARTIYAILIEGGHPEKFGFPHFKNAFLYFNKKRTLIYLNKHPLLYHAWFDIADRAIELKKLLLHSTYWKYIKWLTKIKRDNPKSYEPHYSYFRILAHRVLDTINHIRKEKTYADNLRKQLKNKPVIILFGTPTHCNIGDAGIAQAEIDFIKNIGLQPVEITVDEWKKYKKVIKKIVNSNFLLLHGGGNFGNLWPTEESIREDIIKTFPNSRFLLLPQTFYITNSLSDESLKRFIDSYNNSRFSLCARENNSFERIQKLFPLANSYLVPDIVLYEKNNVFYDVSSKEKTFDVMLVLRNDRESLLDYDDKVLIKNMLSSNGFTFRQSDMLYHSPIISKSDRSKVVLQKILEFTSSRVVITDRLHGMIFAFIANVPCIVLKNNNYKIVGVHKWIENNNSVYIADKIDDLPFLIKQAIENPSRNRFPSRYFDNLKKLILDGAKNDNC